MDNKQESEKKEKFWTMHLPLETETCYFVLANALDAIMTRLLLNFEQFRESNIIADYVLTNFGMRGMIYFKFIVVAVVVIIAQIVARKKLHVARYLLIGGTLFVSGVVIYSCYLWVAHGGFFTGGESEAITN